MRIKVKAFGCKLNQCEAGGIERELSSAGHEIVGKPPYDAVVVCGCTVTMRADYKVRQYLRRMVRDYGVKRLFLSGCSAVSFDEDVIGELAVEKAFSKNDGTKIAEYLGRGNAGQDFPQTFHGRTRGYVKIQDGCDQFCSYCIVPLVRGRERSIPSDAVIARVKELERAGVKEAVLTGVHDGRYFADGLDLAALCRQILDETEILRLRLSSVESEKITNDLIDLLSREKRLANHLHVPLQSGSDSVLARMNRQYAANDYAKTIHKLADSVDDIGIGADVIVGFPGETDIEFEDTYELINSLPFSYLHVFRYSPRPGTAAAKMPDPVHTETARVRMERLRALHEDLRRKFAESQFGITRNVIIERIRDGIGHGWTDNYMRVEVPVDNNDKGKMISVKPKSYTNGVVHCEKINSI
ncbi:MAG: MiaB/RimO family radical SAM methylthiotransferase [bacterium]